MSTKKSKLEKPVSAFMIPVHTVLFINDSIEEGLAKLRKQKVCEKIVYFYVVNESGKLMGVVTTRALLLADPKEKIGNVVEKRFVSLHKDQTLEEALEIFDTHRLLALPIVTNEGLLLGAIDVEQYMDESFDIADARHRRDVFQLIGLTIEEKVSLFRGYVLRMPWLFCNMLSGFVCAIISRVNQDVIAKYLVLAMFIPLVLTLSESVSMQSMTQSLQILRKPKISLRYAFSRTFREGKIVTVLSLTSGLIVGLVSLLWGDGLLASLTIGTGIFFSVILSACFGILIPIALHTFRLDPKVAAGPVVLMLADTLTTLFYLSIATWWLL